MPRRCKTDALFGVIVPPGRYTVKMFRLTGTRTAPHSEEGGYVNFMGADDQDQIVANYGPNYDRLVEVKRSYDPGNLFHLNQNIAP